MRRGGTLRLYSPSAEPSGSELVYQTEHPTQPYPCANRKIVTLSDDTLRRNLFDDDTQRRVSLACGRLYLLREADVTKVAVPTEPRLQWAHGCKPFAAASDMQHALGRSINAKLGYPCRSLPQCTGGGVQRRTEVGLVGSMTGV